jgi:lysozyme
MDLSIAAMLCKQFEGFRAKPYICPAGVPTIGYGSTYWPDGRRVSLSDSAIEKVQAEWMLFRELERTYLPGVLRMCPGLAADPRRCNAIVDFAYNLGIGRLQTSTLRRKINMQDWPAAAQELQKWVRGGGKVLPGLVARRKAEAVFLI